MKIENVNPTQILKHMGKPNGNPNVNIEYIWACHVLAFKSLQTMINGSEEKIDGV